MGGYNRFSSPTSLLFKVKCKVFDKITSKLWSRVRGMCGCKIDGIVDLRFGI